MDIGPIRRRFVAEPIASPVPAAESREDEAPVLEPATEEHPAARDAVPTAHA